MNLKGKMGKTNFIPEPYGLPFELTKKDTYKMELPKINYKGEECTVDFRLGEMRCFSEKPESTKGFEKNLHTWKTVKFVDLKEDKNSPIKKELRVLRFRTSNMDYIRGLDD